MFVKARFEMWLEDTSSEAGKSTNDDPDSSSYCRVMDTVIAACEAEKGMLWTATLLRAAESVADIREESARKFFLDKMRILEVKQ